LVSVLWPQPVGYFFPPWGLVFLVGGPGPTNLVVSFGGFRTRFSLFDPGAMFLFGLQGTVLLE